MSPINLNRVVTGPEHYYLRAVCVNCGRIGMVRFKKGERANFQRQPCPRCEVVGDLRRCFGEHT